MMVRSSSRMLAWRSSSRLSSVICPPGLSIEYSIVWTLVQHRDVGGLFQWFPYSLGGNAQTFFGGYGVGLVGKFSLPGVVKLRNNSSAINGTYGAINFDVIRRTS